MIRRLDPSIEEKPDPEKKPEEARENPTVLSEDPSTPAAPDEDPTSEAALSSKDTAIEDTDADGASAPTPPTDGETFSRGGVYASEPRFEVAEPAENGTAAPEAVTEGVFHFEEKPAFRPTVASFAGPLDLLLYLLHKNEVDIFDIPIVEILEQYMEHVGQLERAGILDLVEAGEFLLMGSRLMEIKSRMLLPDDTVGVEDEALEEELTDPRLSLVEQLLEYRDIKERAVLLEQRHDEWSRRYDRPPERIPKPEGETLELAKTTVWDLCAAFDRVLEDAKGAAESVQVIPIDDTPIEELIQGIRTRLETASDGSIGFRDLFRPELGPAVLIANFLALLEMCRLHLIRVKQEQELGEIRLTLRAAS